MPDLQEHQKTRYSECPPNNSMRLTLRRSTLDAPVWLVQLQATHRPSERTEHLCAVVSGVSRRHGGVARSGGGTGGGARQARPASSQLVESDLELAPSVEISAARNSCQSQGLRCSDRARRGVAACLRSASPGLKAVTVSARSQMRATLACAVRGSRRGDGGWHDGRLRVGIGTPARTWQ